MLVKSQTFPAVMIVASDFQDLEILFVIFSVFDFRFFKLAFSETLAMRVSGRSATGDISFVG